MKTLLVTSEFFAWGVYGGYGSFARKLGGELVKHGVEVDAIVQKKRIGEGQKPIGETEIIDGVNVLTIPNRKLAKIRGKKRYYSTDADVIHSQPEMFDTCLAFETNPLATKVITFQDLRTKKEVKDLEVYERVSYPWWKRIWEMYVNHKIKRAVRMADCLCFQAELLKPKAKELYEVSEEKMVFMPNFLDIPKEEMKKTDEPSVVWLGRLDPIKRPEICFDLAKVTPDVQFYILGSAHDKQRDEMLRQQYKNVDNLHFLGFQAGQIKEETLSKAWILINTSMYEALPVSFLEALAHRCAILSTRNPDGYTARFGVESDAFCLRQNLEWLIEDDRWKELGNRGHEYVSKVHSTENGVQMHLDLYKRLLR